MNDATTVTLHRYRILDPETGDWVVQLNRGTEYHIKQVGGRIIEGTAEQVSLSTLATYHREVGSLR